MDDLSGITGLYQDNDSYLFDCVNPARDLSSSSSLLKATCFVILALFYDAGQLDSLKFTPYPHGKSTSTLDTSSALQAGDGVADMACGGEVSLYAALIDVLAGGEALDPVAELHTSSTRRSYMDAVGITEDRELKRWVMDDVIPAILSRGLGSGPESWAFGNVLSQEEDDEI